MTLRPFHLAIAVDDLVLAEEFYGDIMGCPRGRRSDAWIDFNFYGHQLVTHLSPVDVQKARTNDVDGKQVPARHFGIILDKLDWRDLADRLIDANCKFIIEPGIRFESDPGEQGTFFLLDPAGNALEFKYFDDDAQIFAT